VEIIERIKNLDDRVFLTLIGERKEIDVSEKHAGH